MLSLYLQAVQLDSASSLLREQAVSPPAPAALWVQPAAETAHGSPHWGHPGFPKQQGLINIIRKTKQTILFVSLLTSKNIYLLKVTLLSTRI